MAESIAPTRFEEAIFNNTEKKQNRTRTIVFMGTPEFAATVLEGFASKEEVVGVVTAPDAAGGRGRRLRPSPVKETAFRIGIPNVIVPQRFGPDELSWLSALSPDAIVVAAYGKLLPPEVLSLPRLGCLNVHASLLPRWRGAAPVERAILSGDDEIGFSIMKMEAGLDTGPWCLQKPYDARDAYARELLDTMAKDAPGVLSEALDSIEGGTAEWHFQDGTAATYAKKLGKRELYAEAGDTAEELCRKVRASGPQRACKLSLCGKGVSIMRAVHVAENPGEIAAGIAVFHSKKLFLGCVGGTAAELLAVKPDGKGEMSVKAFAAGIPEIRSEGASWKPLA